MQAPHPEMPAWLPPAFTAPCRKPQTDALFNRQPACRPETRQNQPKSTVSGPTAMREELQGCPPPDRDCESALRRSASWGAVQIDLNADVGESFGAYRYGDDEGVLPCRLVRQHCLRFSRGRSGRHAPHGPACGSPRHRPCGCPSRLSRSAGLRPPRDMHISTAELESLVAYQIGALAAVAATEGARLSHVKPHGALYNMAARDAAMADAIARAVRAVDAIARALWPVGLTADRRRRTRRTARGVRGVCRPRLLAGRQPGPARHARRNHHGSGRGGAPRRRDGHGAGSRPASTAP